MNTWILVLALIIGATQGLFGAGGSILTVPLLHYLGGFTAPQAFAATFPIVGAASFAGFLRNARGNVTFATAAMFGMFTMTGVWIGGVLAKDMPGQTRLTLLALLMVAASVSMWLGKAPSGKRATMTKPQLLLRVAPVGLVIGLLAGMVSMGGGFLIFPSLVLLFGLSAQAAVATSLLIVTCNCAVGTVAHWHDLPTDLMPVAVFLVFATAGTVFGAAVSKRLPQTTMRKGFAVFVLLLAVFVMLRETTNLMPKKAPSTTGNTATNPPPGD